MSDVSERLANRIQLTTDGNRVYLDAVDQYFGEIDYAMLVKLYGNETGTPETAIALASAWGAEKRPSVATPIWTTFRPATANGRT